MSLLGWDLIYSGALVRRGVWRTQRESKNSAIDETKRSCTDTVKLSFGEPQEKYGLAFIQIKYLRF